MEVYGYAVIPVIVGLVEILKRAGLPKRFAPLASVLLGIIIGFYYLAPGDPLQAVFLGIVVGLSAVGLFSGTKNSLRKK